LIAALKALRHPKAKAIFLVGEEPGGKMD